MNHWKYILALHNLPIVEPIGNEFIKIVPFDDSLVVQMRKDTESFDLFVKSFIDQFKRPSKPSFLFFNSSEDPTLELLVSFRNALAISSVTKAWGNYIGHGRQGEHYKYSDYFDFYPYSLTKDKKYLYSNTPSTMSLDDPKKFLGQTAPGIAKASEKKDFYDEEIFNALLDRWCEYFVQNKKRKWSLIALFRSLEMAYRASALPYGNNGTIHDYGANICLWVSAFEILLHPGTNSVGYKDVLSLLEKYKSHINRIGYKRYRAKLGKKTVALTLVQKTYYEMHVARNNFLHGNPVSFKDLFPASNTTYPILNFCAPLLYKCALEVFLGINQEIDMNDVSNVKKFIRIRNSAEAILNIRNKIE